MIENSLKIFKFRTLRGLTQEQMAEALSISQSHYCKMEKGKKNITIQRMTQIAKLLKVNVVELLDNKEVTFVDKSDKNKV